jgi:hypothetical protein
MKNTQTKQHNQLNKERTFRINAKNLFLTYSQIDKNLTKEYILDQLSKNLEIKNYVIALENHIDSGIHSHVLLQLNKKCNIRSKSLLDITFKTKTYHGNYQRIRNSNAVLQYVIKDGNFISNKEFHIHTDSNNKLISLEMHILQSARKNGINKALNDFIKIDEEKALKKIDRLEKTITKILKIESKEKEDTNV